MFHYFSVVLQKYAVFRGRARRAEYWYFFLATILLSLAIGIVFGVLGLVAGFSPGAISRGSDMLSLVVQLGLILPSITVGVRRLHDSNKSGWWLLVPFYNFYLLVRPGTVGENRFGPDPKASPVPVPSPAGETDVPPLPPPVSG